jgi:penicillin-binding protein 1C
MTDNDHDMEKSELESPSEKLRKILQSRKKEQGIKPINGESEEAIRANPDKKVVLDKFTADKGEIKAAERNLSDTQQIPRLNSRDNVPGKSSSIKDIFAKTNRTITKIIKKAFNLLFNIFKRPKGNRNLFKHMLENPQGCLVAGALISVFSGIIIGILSLSFLIVQYFTIAAGLPGVENLQQYASQFETTRIFDRNGNLIYEILDPNAGRRTYVSLDEISPAVIAATIATEDKDFYSNPGFDPLGILRAFWQNYTSGEVISGASTITQQLARTLMLSPEERVEISTRRKTREIVLAAEITRKYSKDEILELYLNEIYYGNLAYGIEAAAETYFNTSADQLNLAQASFLAGLPQAPAIYDIFSNREGSLLRHLDVLNLMYQLSKDRSCIAVNHYTVPICVTLEEAAASASEIESYDFQQRLIKMPYPHWVNYIRTQLEAQYDPQTIYRSGFRIFTTLDPDFQLYAQNALSDQVEKLAANNTSDGALVAIQPQTGEILAMIGSADFFNEEISGQVNMATAPRQPGSSIKPLTYAAAFEKGWSPATLIWDVPSEFPPSGNPDDTREPYEPVNYDGKFHGPVLLRTALGSSYNIPAVKTLDYVGIYNDPETPEAEGIIAFAERMGITTLTREDYGLSLTLGGGDVSLLELTSVYSVFANNGERMAPYAIQRIEDQSGQVLFDHRVDKGDQVIRADHAYLISDILSDNSARTPAFGTNSILRLSFRAAVKTGTTNDFRDNWTVGYTPDIAIGVWIGNADYTPMKNISGVTGAAPLWADAMQWAVETYKNGESSRFVQPDTIEEHVICSVSGTKPSDQCPSEKSEIFAAGQSPLPADQDLWNEIALDTWTNLKAGPACSEFTEEKLTLQVNEKWAVKWIQNDGAGRAWAESNGFKEPIIFTPERECRGNDPKPSIVFVGLTDGMDISVSPLDIYAVINATDNFERFRLQYGVGNNPSKWNTILKDDKQYDSPTKLISWKVNGIDATRITLRIYLYSAKDTFAEKRIHLDLLVPTATPTLIPSPTETLMPTETPISTETPLPTATNLPSSNTPVPTDTVAPSDTPSP